MELEALKSLAFASGCRLLHLHLIENHETILLLPRFATSPTDLHVAVSQALLSLVTSVRSFDRPYLSYLSALLLDLFVFLRGQVTLPMAAFTQQSVLTGLLEAVLSPVVQQRQEEKSCWLRGQLYLPLLSFLTYSFSHCLISRLAIQQNTFDLLLQPLQSALSLLVPSLAQDTLLTDLQGRTAALSLMNLLLQSSVGDVTLQLVLAERDVIRVWMRRSVRCRVCFKCSVMLIRVSSMIPLLLEISVKCRCVLDE